MRTPPIETPPEIAKRDTGLIKQVRHYRIITPLYGGGVRPVEADPVTVVRGTEVRGHLRFWWRACRGGQFGTVRRMRQAEDALWGAASSEDVPNPSLVQVVVAVDENGRGHPLDPYVQVEEWDNRQGRMRKKTVASNEVPAYASFPLDPRETKGGPAQPKKLRTGVAFTLTLFYPKDRAADIDAALWAWETCGGLGARTRRGFGALQCDKVTVFEDPTDLKSKGRTEPVNQPAEPKQAEAWLREQLRRYVAPGSWPAGVPHLSTVVNCVCTADKGNPTLAWKDLIAKLSDFRQQRTQGRRGRSLWPEPNAIRLRTGQHSTNHAAPAGSPDAFPRAAFGLPIIFHFKDDAANPPDPRETSLEGGTHDRLASRLILRPLVCAAGVTGLALVLDAPSEPPEGVALKDKKGNTDVGPLPVSAAPPAGLVTLHGESDVFAAFLATLK